MRFVKPQVTALTFNGPDAVERKIEFAYRICYRSEHRMTEDSYKEFLPRMLQHGDVKTQHTSPLAHGYVKFTTSYFVYDLIKKLSEQLLYNTSQYFKVIDQVGARISIRTNCRALFELINVVVKSEDINASFKMGATVVKMLSNALHERFPYIFKEYEIEDTSICKKMMLEEVNKFDIDKYYSTYDDGWLTVLITTSRDMLQQIARHKTIDLSVESTRYVNYEKRDGIPFLTCDFPPLHIAEEELMKCPEVSFKGDTEYEYLPLDNISNSYVKYCKYVEEKYFDCLHHWGKPDGAKHILNGSVVTHIVATATREAWEHFYDLRGPGTGAHQCIQFIADQAKLILNNRNDSC